MRQFLIRRFFFSIVTLITATLVVFTLSRLSGDPLLLYAKPGGYGVLPAQVEALEQKLGLDKPLVFQYFIWLGQVVRGDLGNTLLSESPVTSVIGDKLGPTIKLGLAAWVFAVVLGVPLGVFSAVKRGTFLDYLGRGFALFGQALPVFWIGIMAILIFAVNLEWLPSGTLPSHEPLSVQWKHFVLPTIALGWLPAAVYVRLTRSAMLEVLDSEFVKLARAKGVRGQTIIWKHALRNALIPPITVSALVMASFLEGSVVVESVFSWPGLGRQAVESIFNNDFPLLTGIVLLFAVLYVVMNIIADLLYVVVDPRIRLN
ncbi:MAG: ABC transporter permease [Dehalococcoidia bacterium]